MKPRATVIISTYNQPEWLEKVLWGYEVQTVNAFEIIIADDGSTDTTKTLIADFIEKSALHIKHIWQEDHGFQKTKILNKAIQAANAAYLIMTDGDCIPRSDFVAKHLKLQKKGCFLSGGYFKLPMHISKAISRDHITS
ncbi:MAG: glycosyltransferase, partial [Bacteroidota bacterium]